MSTPVSTQRYSAVIKGDLVFGNRCLPLAHVAADFIILHTPTDLPPGPAALVIDVDGNVTRREIDLPQGASVDSPRIPVVRR